MSLDKVVGSAAEAVADIHSGSSVAVGGFGLAGIPVLIIEALLDQRTDDLTVASNNCGADGAGLGPPSSNAAGWAGWSPPTWEEQGVRPSVSPWTSSWESSCRTPTAADPNPAARARGDL